MISSQDVKLGKVAALLVKHSRSICVREYATYTGLRPINPGMESIIKNY